MDKKLLESIGLTGSEVDVYLALLELGSTTTGKIIEKSGTASSKIYEILDKLMRKGLASFVIKSKVKYYQAASPKRILDYVKEKEEKLKTQKDQISRMIPELELKQKLTEHKIEATIYKDLKGVETAFYNALEKMDKNDEFLVFGIPQRTPEVDRFFVHFGNKRAEKKIQSREIFKQNYKGDQIKNIPLQKIKYSSQPTFSAVNIMKDKVLLFPETKDLTVIDIEGKEIADSFKAQFEALWNQEVSVSTGWNALRTELKNYMNSFKKTGEEYLAIGAAFGPKGVKDEYIKFFNEMAKYRTNLKIKTRILYEKGTQEDIKRKESDYKEYAQYKFLPYETNSPVAILPSKEKTLIIIQKKEPVTITLEGKEISNSFKQHFETLWNQEVRIEKGLDAVQDIFEEILEAGHCDFLGARGYFMDKRPEYTNDWIRRAKEKGFTMRNITDIETKNHKITKLPFAKTKYNIEKEFSQLSVFWIYGEKVVIGNWTEDEPILTIIENKKYYELYKKQFTTLWNKKLGVYEGESGVQYIYTELLNKIKKEDEIIIFATQPKTKTQSDFNLDWCKKALKICKGIKFLYFGKTPDKIKRAKKMIEIGCEARIIDTKQTVPISNVIFGDTILNGEWETPFAYTTTSHFIAKSFRENFYLKWNSKDAITDF